MKVIYFLTILLILPLTTSFSQVKTEQDMETAYQNAKKGIYWALSNIPFKKSTMDNDLIAEDKLYASVKLSTRYAGATVAHKGSGLWYAWGNLE